MTELYIMVSRQLLLFYRPQRSCGKVMFSKASVILFTGGYLADTFPGQTPLQQTATASDGTHPTGMHSCYRPQTKFAKVMFLHVSVILFTRGCLQAHSQGEVEGSGWGRGLQAHTEGGGWGSGRGGIQGINHNPNPHPEMTPRDRAWVQRYPASPMDRHRQTPVKTFPSRNFVGGWQIWQRRPYVQVDGSSTKGMPARV